VSREFAVLDLKPGKARSESDTLDALKALLMGSVGNEARGWDASCRDREEADVAIQELRGALRFLDRYVAVARPETGVSRRPTGPQGDGDPAPRLTRGRQ
jgi:hypothetical protein